MINIIPFDQFVKLIYILCQEFNDSNEEKQYVSGFGGGGGAEAFSARKVKNAFLARANNGNPASSDNRKYKKNYILGKTIQPYLKKYAT